MSQVDAATDFAIPSAPPRSSLWRESRAVIDVVRMLPWLMMARRQVDTSSSSGPVIVLPGFGAGDRLMTPLRRFLLSRGHAAEGWGLGINRAGLDLKHRLADISALWNLSDIEPYRREAGVALLCDRMVERVQQRALETGKPCTLIGWSLGGTIAREVARDAPEAVDQVITLGSPVIGGPKYTAAGESLRARGLDLDWIEVQVKRRDVRPIHRPITSIVSRSDGIVPWSAAIDRVSPDVRHIEVRGAHLGLAFNPTVWQHVLKTLQKDAFALRSDIG